MTLDIIEKLKAERDDARETIERLSIRLEASPTTALLDAVEEVLEAWDFLNAPTSGVYVPPQYRAPFDVLRAAFPAAIRAERTVTP